AHKRDLNNLYQVIYYGDSQVEVGKPFSISCIISIANPVEWHKDGEPIRKHSNIRHGKDEHSYIESEMGIAGNRDKIEASISVQRALPKHQGRYQCNALYKNYHQLYVYRNGTLLGHSSATSSAGSSSRIPEKHHDDMQLMLSTVKSTLVAPLSVEHHHFTTAVALAPGPAVIDEEFPGGSLEREHERERESSKSSAHSPHHHRQQAGVGHRHHAGSSAEKKPQQHDDSKRFVSQKTTIDPDSLSPEEVLEQTVEDLEDYSPVLHTDKSSTVIKPKHSTTGRKLPPPPLMETREDEDEDPLPEGVREGETQDLINLDTSVGAENIEEDLVEPDTEIVIESKAISLEDDNIDRLIQNKSDINGIILVDSLEELTSHKKPPNGESTALIVPMHPTVGSATKTVGNVSTSHQGLPIPGMDSTIASMVGPTGIQQTSPKEESIIIVTSSTVGPPPPVVLGGEQDNTVHHHHHHHHEHHTTTTAAKAPTTSTTTTTTTTTTVSIPTTTATMAPLLTTTAA
uniref:Ig-like domain-containing protein n=1 Tax=Anopheles minimus TaxID=112268 RepID=A0A182VUE9_9DIPT